MKKYTVTAHKNCDLHLYADAEFAALLWKDVEADSGGETSDNEDVTTLSLKIGDQLLVESYGYEYIDTELINYLSITQVFGVTNLIQTTIDYLAWVPSKVLNLKENNSNFNIMPYLGSNEK